ncbi:MAG TPA: helix-turn-helix domain-containing protein [Gaiellaceae bacterium]
MIRSVTQDETRTAIESIARLRTAERAADAGTRSQIASARRFLERLVGPTVRPADAARVLGVSRPSLKRWIDKGEIATVRTPTGRREVPVSELVSLLEELNQTEAREGRPLGRVLRERRRRAEEGVDIDRLLPRRRSRDHRVPELQALAYHRLVAERLDEKLVEEARERLSEWREEGRIHPTWEERWRGLLAQPISRIAEILSADTKAARALRQTSPFVGVLTEHERRRLVRAVEERAAS